MKIQIIGFSGSGKSTLARILSKHYNIPVLHLDSVHFYGDWQERTIEEQNEIVSDFIIHNPDWVVDGNYSMIASNRFELSDITIFLAYNRLTCYWNCLKRYRQHRGKHRLDCPCIEKFDWEFQQWILWKGRTNKRIKKMYSNLHKTRGTKLVFKNRKQLIRWLKDQHIHNEINE